MRYLVILFLILSCKNPVTRIIDKFPNGKPSVIFNYPDRSDLSIFSIKVFYVNGKIKKELTIKDGRFIGKVLYYSKKGNLIQIDSLTKPCDTLIKACDAIRTGYYENGSIVEKSILKNGKYDGHIQFYDGNGILVKEYNLRDDSIKTGVYKEYDTLGKLAVMSQYKNDTLTGYTYFFKANGDTLKYYFNEQGDIVFPYKKWLNNGIILYGNYVDEKKVKVIWKWYKEGKIIKSIVAKPKNFGFDVPE